MTELMNLNWLKRAFGKNCSYKCPAAIETQKQLKCMSNNLVAYSENALRTKGLLWSLAYFNERPEQIVHFCEYRDALTIVTMVVKHGSCARLRKLDFKAYICTHSRFPCEVFELSIDFDYRKQNNLLIGKAIISHCMAKNNNENKGYGSMVMEQFLRYIKVLHMELAIGTVTARLSSVDETDINNKNRRNHFYEKYGFKIDGERAVLNL